MGIADIETMNEKFLNKIIEGDCLEILPQIESESVDLILTDPPYNWGKDFSGDNMEVKDFTIFLNKTFNELYRVSNGWICVDIPRTELVYFHSIICRKFLFYDYFCLAVNNSMANCGLGIDRFCLKLIARKSVKNKVKNRRSNYYCTQRFANAKYTGHPTQKDLNGYKYVISMLSNEGDLVLDPFIGSGTTAVACKQFNRNFIGIEIDPEYVKIAKKRLAGVPVSLTSFEDKSNHQQ